MKKQYQILIILLAISLVFCFSTSAKTDNSISLLRATDANHSLLKLSITPDTKICSGESLELKAEASNATGKIHFQWDQGLGEGAIHQVSPLKSTVFTVEAKDEAGNTAKASVNITVLEKPVPNVSGLQKICPGVNAELDAGDFVAYAWSSGENTRKITITDDGEFSLRVKDENGCWGEATFQIEEREVKSPRITGELGFCPGLTAKLDAGDFASYQWSTGEKTRTIEVADDDFYSVTVTDEYGCTSHAKEKVEEHEAAIPKISGDYFFCPGSTTRLDASGDFDFYTWSTGETIPIIYVGKEGVYRLDVETEDGCLGGKSFTVKELEAPKPTIEGSSVLCPGETVQLNTGSFSRYLWSTGDSTQNIEITQAGPYQLTVTDEQGCTGETTLQIDPIPTNIQAIDAGPDQEIQPGETIKLSAGKARKYLWEPAASLNCTDCRRPQATPSETTTYHLTVWDKNGCSAQDSVTVNVVDK